MKKIISIIILIVFCFSLASCEVDDFGSKRITDISEYGNYASFIEIPEYFPDSIANYTVNSYSYSLESWFDTCYEVFIDITVTEEEFRKLISDVMADTRTKKLGNAYYSAGFEEIIFSDDYYTYDDGISVATADIEKVVYNEETYTIVYVLFFANDTGVYPISDIAYFNRFMIKGSEYSNKNNNTGI